MGVIADAAGEPIYAQTLFSIDKVHTLDITVDDDDWAGMLENAQNEEYISVDITLDGERLTNVAIRPKGNSTLSQMVRSDSDRYSFKIEFDHYDNGKNYDGLDKLTLNNLTQDNTLMKDYLSYHMMNDMGALAPLSSYIYITKNGEDWGLYLAVESIEESFAERNFGKTYGDIYKPNNDNMGGGFGGSRGGPGGRRWRDMSGFDLGSFDLGNPSAWANMPGGGGFGGGPPGGGRGFGGSGGGFGGGFGRRGSSDIALIYSDDELTSYSSIFDNAMFKPSKSDKNRLIASLKKMNEGNVIDSVNIDEVIRYFVVHNFVINSDSYTGNFMHNYYLYEKDGLLSMIAWDYNLAFGGMGGMGGGRGAGDNADNAMPTGDVADNTRPTGDNAGHPSDNAHTSDSDLDGANIDTDGETANLSKSNPEVEITNLNFVPGESSSNGERPMGPPPSGASSNGERPMGPPPSGASSNGERPMGPPSNAGEDFGAIDEPPTGDFPNESFPAEEGEPNNPDFAEYEENPNDQDSDDVTIDFFDEHGNSVDFYGVYDNPNGETEPIDSAPDEFPGGFGFGGFGGGMFGGGGSATSTVNTPIDSPVFSGSIEERPMIAWIFDSKRYTEQYHEVFREFAAYLESDEFEAFFDNTVDIISPYVQIDPSIECTYEDFVLASDTFKEFLALRTQSVRGQLAGSIPSTTEGQTEDDSRLIDASGIDISKMGSNRGFGGGGRWGQDADDSETTDE
jgi:spore coat protein CotH